MPGKTHAIHRSTTRPSARTKRRQGIPRKQVCLPIERNLSFCSFCVLDRLSSNPVSGFCLAVPKRAGAELESERYDLNREAAPSRFGIDKGRRLRVRSGAIFFLFAYTYPAQGKPDVKWQRIAVPSLTERMDCRVAHFVPSSQ